MEITRRRDETDHCCGLRAAGGGRDWGRKTI